MRDIETRARTHRWRRRLGGLTAAGVAAALLVACSGPGSGTTPSNGSSGASYSLVGGDKVAAIAASGSMPAIGTEGDSIVGFEAPLFTTAMQRLGLDYDVTWADFAGGLAAIQAGRNDMMIGSIAWSASRAQTGLFTDPIYYVPTVFAEKKGAGIKTIEGLSGHRIGTVTGYYFIQTLQGMPGVDLQVYPDIATTLADLDAGRIDVALLDATVMVYTAKTRPDLDIEAVVADPPTAEQLAAHPEWESLGPIMAEWYLPKGEEALRDALNGVIREMYQDGTIEDALKQYGFEDPSEWLTLDDFWHDKLQQQRRDADRPSDWTLPALGAAK